MIRFIALAAVLIAPLAAQASEEEAPCAETDFECKQSRERERFLSQLKDRKEAWLETWSDAKKRGETMLKEQKLSCGELSGMERMKCRVEAAKKLKEWKKKHDEKKADYIEKIEKLKADFQRSQSKEDSLWSKVKNDFSEKAEGIKEKLLSDDTAKQFLGPMRSGETLEGHVNQALQAGAAGAANAGKWAAERSAHYEKLKTDRDACRSAAAVSACLEKVGKAHDDWKAEFEKRKKQAEEAAKNFKLPGKE
jgi:hypothetical protein